MNLKNVFGLEGTLILLQLIESLDLDFVTACAVLILSGECETRVETKRANLTPRNPMELLSDKQFKKEFRFSKADIPRLLRCLQWPVFFFPSTTELSFLQRFVS